MKGNEPKPFQRLFAVQVPGVIWELDLLIPIQLRSYILLSHLTRPSHRKAKDRFFLLLLSLLFFRTKDKKKTDSNYLVLLFPKFWTPLIRVSLRKTHDCSTVLFFWGGGSMSLRVKGTKYVSASQIPMHAERMLPLCFLWSFMDFSRYLELNTTMNNDRQITAFFPLHHKGIKVYIFFRDQIPFWEILIYVTNYEC